MINCSIEQNAFSLLHTVPGTKMNEITFWIRAENRSIKPQLIDTVQIYTMTKEFITIRPLNIN